MEECKNEFQGGNISNFIFGGNNLGKTIMVAGNIKKSGLKI